MKQKMSITIEEEKIRKAGGHVEPISTADELRGRTVKIADAFYRRHIL